MEELASEYARKNNAPIIVVRPSTVIGVGEPPNHLIPKLIESCKTGIKIPFVPEPTHDFIDVRDFISGLILVAKQADECRGCVYNISTNLATSNQEVLNTVERVVGRKANVEIAKSLRPYDNPNWRVNNSAIKRLGWKQEYNLEDSVKSMIEEYDK
jgi:nucleoside-diphosphate-sugar epimerase